MANAAAKKAAAARASASSTYLPIVLGINAVHVLIRLYQWRTFATLPNLLLTVLLWALTGFAYKGIIDDHADSASAKMANEGRRRRLRLGETRSTFSGWSSLSSTARPF